jgi:ElaB/YqjD/DUF883 family membrane-anchored ribosome-binding protein
LKEPKLQKSNGNQTNTSKHVCQQARLAIPQGKVMKTQVPTQSRDTTTVIGNSVAPDGEAPRSITQRVASSAHDTINSAAVKADELEVHLRAGAVKAGTKLEASQEAATAQVEKSLAKLETFVKGRPIAAAGIAFAAGVLATALLRR